jgi:type IV pilus assembly protein PilC
MFKLERNGLSAAELSNFCGQVALILEAGLPLYDGMETLAGADSGSAHADVYSAASKGVTETGSLYDAIKDDDRWPKYLVEMVGIGERSGQLDQVMRGLEAYYAREDRIRSSISSAVTYPLVLGVMLIVIVLILLWKVLPVFRRVLNSMGASLNESGSLLMRLGVSVGWIILALVALVVVLVVTGVVLSRTKHRDKVMRVVQRVMPGLQKLNKKLSASRVASVLSMMLSSGFPTDEALEMTANVLSDRNAAEKVQSIRKSLEDGSTFAEAVTKTNLFEDLHNRMITMGSATGQEDQVLGKLASLYEEQVEDGITRLVAIIEPTLVALLSVVIGAVLLSVMLPMAGILTSL